MCVCTYRHVSCSVESTQARMYFVSSLCVRQSAYSVRGGQEKVQRSESTKKKECLPRSAANPLCRLSASLAHTISVIFISISPLSDLSLFLFSPPFYSIALPGCLLGNPSMTADTQQTHACMHTNTGAVTLLQTVEIT